MSKNYRSVENKCFFSKENDYFDRSMVYLKAAKVWQLPKDKRICYG